MRVLVTGGAGYILKKTNSSLSGPCSGTKPPVACTVLQRSCGWTPQYQNLDSIVSSPWAWMQSHPGGYPKHI